MRIGFFDSGLGGLMILKEVRNLLPQYDYVYYGDTANLPYGDKSEEEIYTLTERGVETLFNAGAILVIVACNTASAESLRRLQDGFLHSKYPDRKVLGVIIPTVEVLTAMHAHRALLVGTKRTIESKKFEKELGKLTHEITLVSQATPELVPLIESGHTVEAFHKLKKVINGQTGEIDTIVLGCTHYVLLKNLIKAEYPKLQIIAQDEIIPSKIQTYLEAHPELKVKLTRGKSVEFKLSAETPEYERIKTTLLTKGE